MSKKVPNKKDLDRKFKITKEQIKSLVAIISELSEDELKEEFCEVWKSLQEIVYDVNYTVPDLDDIIKQKYISKILKVSIDLSYEILKNVTNKRLRYLVIHIFLDWIINEAIRWNIELPKIEIPEPLTYSKFNKESTHNVNLLKESISRENYIWVPLTYSKFNKESTHHFMYNIFANLLKESIGRESYIYWAVNEAIKRVPIFTFKALEKDVTQYLSKKSEEFETYISKEKTRDLGLCYLIEGDDYT